MESGILKNEVIDGLTPKDQILVRLVQSGVAMDSLAFIHGKLISDGYATPDRIEALPYGIARWRDSTPQCWDDLRLKMQPVKAIDVMLKQAAKVMAANRQAQQQRVAQ